MDVRAAEPRRRLNFRLDSSDRGRRRVLAATIGRGP